MCKVDGIEVTREELPAWEAALASFQLNLRGCLELVRTSAEARAERQGGDPYACLAARAR
jgi:hypothetical protein